MLKEIVRRQKIDSHLDHTPKGTLNHIPVCKMVEWLETNVISDERVYIENSIGELIEKMTDYHLRVANGGGAIMLRECRFVEAVPHPSLRTGWITRYDTKT